MTGVSGFGVKCCCSTGISTRAGHLALDMKAMHTGLRTAIPSNKYFKNVTMMHTLSEIVKYSLERSLKCHINKDKMEYFLL